MKKKKKTLKRRSFVAQAMILRTGGHAGKHHNRTADLRKGSSRKFKHAGRQNEQ